MPPPEEHHGADPANVRERPELLYPYRYIVEGSWIDPRSGEVKTQRAVIDSIIEYSEDELDHAVGSVFEDYANTPEYDGFNAPPRTGVAISYRTLYILWSDL